ncbi:MAG: DNA polymerase III subunit gamma/tau [Clostridiales bacterium]|nr:DNA polymerase III subunit gamma/tau [Clostridiales bacterium]
MYQVLYRKYRPQVFGDVVGQAHITDTLVHEIQEGRLAHAYLFTGSRGTGKTSCAKILAKAVNCLAPVEGSPCNQCVVCRAADDGTNFDIVEIDAASNNGVDNIRELRDETNFTPSMGKYRVYIIDEVHMLSIGAFNALLKTLEEPPSHVKFILATTEVHKLPATILSRCQRFDFRRIAPEDMAKRLQYVARQEGFALKEDGALLIARLADGALRDALSLLDQCAGREGEIDAALVAAATGMAGREYLHRLARCIGEQDSAAAMALVHELHQESCDMERLCSELIQHFRNLMMVKSVPDSRALIVCDDQEFQMYRQSAGQFDLERILYVLDVLQSSLERIRRGAQRRTEMELAVVRLCTPALEETVPALLERMAALEKQWKRFSASGPVGRSADRERECPAGEALSAGNSETPQGKEHPLSAKPPAAPEEPALTEQSGVPGGNALPQEAPNENSAPLSGADADVPLETWGEVLESIRGIDVPLYGILDGSKAFVRGDSLLIDSPNPIIRDFIRIAIHHKAIKDALAEVTGQVYRIGIYKRPEQPAAKKDTLEDLLNRAKENGIEVSYS